MGFVVVGKKCFRRINRQKHPIHNGCIRKGIRVNDPSAGSPTDTLLRLLLPLNEQVCATSRRERQVNLSNTLVRGTH